MSQKKLLPLLIIGGLGYLIGLLSAPKKGEDIRKDLKKQAENMRRDLERNVGSKMDKVKHNVEYFKDQIHDHKPELEKKKENVIDNAREEILRILDKVELESKRKKEELEETTRI